MAGLPEYDLAFRPHPRFDEYVAGATARRFAFVTELGLPNVFLTDNRQDSLGEILEAADLCLALTSSVVFDVLAANKPLLVPMWEPWKTELTFQWADPHLWDAVIPVHSPDELAPTIRSVLENPEVWASKQAAVRRFMDGQIDSATDPAEILLRLARMDKPPTG